MNTFLNIAIANWIISLFFLLVTFLIWINIKYHKITIGRILLFLIVSVIPIVNIAVSITMIMFLCAEESFVSINEVQPKILRKIIKFLSKEIKI